MNDRFKFRVAIRQKDGSFKRYQVDIIGRVNDKLYAKCAIPNNIIRSVTITDVLIDGENAILEQYTGLKAKNGKEIFEGDVVKTKQYGKDIDNRINVNDYDTFVVKFHECSFCIENDSRRFRMHAETKLEIIGNIHEKEGK